MDPLATVRRRLVEQGLAGVPFADPVDAVRRLGAVQAQEYAEAQWSLAERTGGAEGDVAAAYARGDIIRTHVLRPTWHFVAREDVRWLLRLTRPRIERLNRYWYGKFELEPDLLVRAHDVLARVLGDQGPSTRRQLAAHLADAGIDATGLRLGYLLMHAELDELICSGPPAGRQHTYALLDERVGHGPLDERPRDSALDELVRRYFGTHGPATVKDFVAWSSLTVGDTVAALERVGGELTRDEDGEHGWFSARHPRAVRSERLAGAFLIPMYDETVVVYASLRVVLAHPLPRGLLERPIVIDGRTVGSWKRTLTRGSATVDATLFGPLTVVQRSALDEAVERFGRFCGRPAALAMRSVAATPAAHDG